MAQYAYGVGQGLPDIVPQSSSFEVSTSVSHSQQSFHNPSDSQPSQDRPASSGPFDLSYGSTYAEIRTPSISLSTRSSQGFSGIGDEEEDEVRISSHVIELQEPSHSIIAPVEEQQKHRVCYTSAPKRMANGEVKYPEYAMPTSQVSNDNYGHSRNSSRTSRSSQISELSSQLKTRLSYAMVKVQNGRQSHNINDLENLTSNQGSPISAASERRRSHVLQVASNRAADFSPSMQSSLPLSGITDYGSTLPQKAVWNEVNADYRDRGKNDRGPSSHIGAAYDSFWREHEASTAPTAAQPRSLPAEGPSLAPPVDILPRNSRLPDTNAQPSPAVCMSNLPKSSNRLCPKTPSPKKPPKLRTPSQQAAVEKDAVESLLFMSSPNNSGYHPRAALAESPLKAEFSCQTSNEPRPGGALRGQSWNGLSVGFLPPLQQQFKPRQPLSDAHIDELLDEMPDTSSSDEERPRGSRTQHRGPAR